MRKKKHVLSLFLVLLSCTWLSGEMTIVEGKSRIPTGMVTHYAGDPKTVYDWFVLLPKNIDPSKKYLILITGPNGDLQTEKYSETIGVYSGVFERKIWKYGDLDYILLCPIIPRTHEFWPIYFPAKAYKDYPRYYAAPDLKVLRILEALQDMLAEQGIKTYPKVFIEGFSAGAIFATRMAFLHPEMVYAIAAGAGGCLNLPLSEYKGTQLPYPLGASDYCTLFGKPFDFASYKSVCQYLYIGVWDFIQSNSILYDTKAIYNQDQLAFLRSCFGDRDPVFLRNQASLLADLGCNIRFKFYKTNHNGDFPEMEDDIRAFFREMESKIRATE